jgi:hypothetical protein
MDSLLSQLASSKASGLASTRALGLSNKNKSLQAEVLGRWGTPTV